MNKQNLKAIKVWDFPTRLSHWSMALLFTILIITGEVGNQWIKWHMLSGYLLSGVIIFRVFWGIWGSYHAQFKNFVRSPKTTIQYCTSLIKGKPEHALGHNPVGALMVVALLLVLAVQSFTGLLTTDDILWNGPLYSWVPSEFAELSSGFHRITEAVLKAMVLIHILAVLFHKYVLKEALVGAMLHGRKYTKHELDITLDVKKRLLAISLLISGAWVFWLWTLPL
jgi:cytochrome b